MRKWNEAVSGEVQMDIRRLFTERAVGHWNRLPSEVAMAPKMPEFKDCLGDIFYHMVLFQVVL